ncbi:hypothetical protein F947_01714 [Acinetobacter towneri DSM 14962 = CIP 107472]|nr:hypothetical protein F947_01714 [Acinetobacter towneri DSM 14962 = CIP 107472]
MSLAVWPETYSGCHVDKTDKNRHERVVMSMT